MERDILNKAKRVILRDANLRKTEKEISSKMQDMKANIVITLEEDIFDFKEIHKQYVDQRDIYKQRVKKNRNYIAKIDALYNLIHENDLGTNQSEKEKEDFGDFLEENSEKGEI